MIETNTLSPLPVRLQLRRIKGFDLQAHSRARNGLACVHCARPSDFGNPFFENALGKFDAFEATWRFKEQLKSAGFFIGVRGKMIDVQTIRSRLRGRNLACFCKEQARFCHVDVLLEVANI